MSDPLAALRDARPAPSVEHRIVEGAMARAAGPQRRTWSLALAGVAVAAAAVLLTFALRPAGEPPGALAPAVDAPTPVVRTETPQMRYQVTEGADAVFRVETPVPNQTVVHLSAGTASFAVEPVPPGGFFAVETPHGRVEVVGTRFSVTVGERCTRVAVTEGKVRVRREADAVLVPAGETREICRGGPAGEAVMRAALQDLAGGRTAAARARLEGYLAAWPDGLFAEEALFHLALLARREGDAQAAAAATTRYLTRFPSGHRADRLRAAP